MIRAFVFFAVVGPSVPRGTRARKTGPRLFGTSRLQSLKDGKAKEIQALPESIQMENLVKKIETGSCVAVESEHTMASTGITKEAFLMGIDAGFATFALHVESRMASMLGDSFHTVTFDL